MYVLTSYVWTLQNYKKFIDYQTQSGDIVIVFLRLFHLAFNIVCSFPFILTYVWDLESAYIL